METIFVALEPIYSEKEEKPIESNPTEAKYVVYNRVAKCGSSSTRLVLAGLSENNHRIRLDSIWRLSFSREAYFYNCLFTRFKAWEDSKNGFITRKMIRK